jgi:catechol 2,3-dioxygenase-like lactoylglutathione lyase family enzyme
MPHPVFKPGRNIAMKLPERFYQETLAFYRDILKLTIVEERDDGALVDFGAVRLHLDRVPHQSQTDLWLQVATEDVEAASKLLAEKGVTRCDEVEKLPAGFQGFWIASPSGTIHLVATAEAAG